MIHNLASLKVEQYYRISVANYPSVDDEIDHFSTVDPTDMIKKKTIKEIQRRQIEEKIQQFLLSYFGEGKYGIKDLEGRYSLHSRVNCKNSQLSYLNKSLLKYTPPPAEYDNTHFPYLLLINTDIPGEFTCPDLEGFIFNIMLDVEGGRRKRKKTRKNKKRRKSRNIFSLF